MLKKAVKVAALAVASVGAWSAVSAQAKDTPSRPNIVVFLADDMGYKDFGAGGDPDIRTPNLDKLTAQGLKFDRAFVASPSCAPSRAAMLTGFMPSRNGAEGNHEIPTDGVPKLPAYLQSLGYQVVAFGKVAHYRTTAMYDFDHFENDTFHNPDAIPSALRWLKAREDKRPLAIFVGSNWPHVPWPEEPEGYSPDEIKLPPKSVDVPISYRARARYYAAVSRMDRELGQTLEVVDDTLGENTFVLFSADHGEQWPFGKWNLYDTGTRVPMVARWTGNIQPGGKTNGMVSWVDILPTLIEVGGGKAPLEIGGRSFAAAFDSPASFEGREEIYTIHNSDLKMNVYPMRSVRTARWKYIANLHPEYVFTTHVDLKPAKGDGGYFPAWRRAALTDPEARQIVDKYYRRPAEELYDLDADPDETHNLAADPQYASVLRELRLKLAGWRDAQNDDRPLKHPPHLQEGPIDGLPDGQP
jgi:N-sulfoglucosamine sulfohydrolase